MKTETKLAKIVCLFRIFSLIETLFFNFTVNFTFILIMVSAAELTEGRSNSKLEPDHQNDEDNA